VTYILPPWVKPYTDVELQYTHEPHRHWFEFIKDLREHFGKDERVITSEIRDKDAIVGSIKDFLGKGV